MRDLPRLLIARREPFLAFLLLVWVGYSWILLVRSETPRGRLSGRVVAQETGAPLPNASVSLAGEGKFWSFTTDRNGRFHLSSLPAGQYRVNASSYAHRLNNGSFTLKEGEQKEIVLALPPRRPFLELLHPQPVFIPTEAIRIGLRGFVEGDALKMEIYQLRLGERAPLSIGELFGSLDEVRYGWWRGNPAWHEQMERLSPALQNIYRASVPITERDGEGVFVQYVPFPLRQPGTYLVRFSIGSLEQVALLIITEAGLIVKSAGNRKLLAWVAHLRSGQPLGGVVVEAWVDRRVAGRTESWRLAQARTDADGIARLTLPPSLTSADRVSLLAHQPSSPLGASSPARPMAWVSLRLEEERFTDRSLTGFLYSDRPVYRPGQTVYYKGILRVHTPQGYKPLPPNTPITVLVRDPDDSLIRRTELRLNRLSSFAAFLRLNEEAKTGLYRITAQNGGGQVEGSFMVAAYRKPTSQISLRPVRKHFTFCDLIQIELNAHYYFGHPLSQAKVFYFVYRLPLMEGEYGEEEIEEEEWENGEYGELVMDGITQTDEAGHAVLTFRHTDLPEKESPPFSFAPRSDYRYTVSVFVEAVGYEYASAKTQFAVTQGDWRVALTPEPGFCAPGEQVLFKIKVQDRQTNAPHQAELRWRAGVIRWHENQAEVEWGGSQGTIRTDATGKAQGSFTPQQAGDWILEVETRDPRGNSMVVQTSVWVSGFTPSEPRPPTAPTLQLLTDKRLYQLGERVRIALRSRVQKGVVLLTVEGDWLHLARLVPLRNGGGTFKLPVERRFLPSVYLSACLVHDKQFVQQTVPLHIGTEAEQLQITIRTDRPQYEPGQTAQISLQVRSAEGRPVQAELSLAVVDEAIYAVREDNPKALFNAFYARRPNRVQTVYSFPWLALQGDKGGVETVRRYFPDTALWLPQLVTDANGTASATLQVPDSLTQWRITVLGHTAETLLGFGVHRFTCTKEFAVRLSVPSVLTEGDETTLSAIVSNNGSQPRQASVELLIDPPPTSPSLQRHVQIRVAPRKSEQVEWTYRADPIGNIRIQVRARSHDGRHDAEERLIRVLPHATEQESTNWLVLKPGSSELILNAPPTLVREASRLEVRLAPSVFSQLLGALDYLADYPYGCTEQTMSRFLPSLMVLRLLREKGIDLPRLRQTVPKMVQEGLARLYRFQHDDGGWGWWETDRSDLWMTAYVMRGLTLAKRAGLPINEEVYRAGRRALEYLVRQSWDEGSRGDRFLFALYALAASGAPVPTYPSETQRGTPEPMFPALSHLTPYGQALLLLALTEWQDQRWQTLAQELTTRLRHQQRRDREGIFWLPVRDEAQENQEEGSYWLNASETTSWVLLALLQAQSLTPHASRIVRQSPEIVRWLLAQRRAVGWQSTKDTAIVIEALLEYARRYERPITTGITVQMSLNGMPVGASRFEPRAVWLPELVVPIPTSRLVEGVNRLQFEVRGGSTPLYATVLFKKSLPLPEQAGELVVGQMQVQRSYTRLRSLRASKEGTSLDEEPLQNGDTVPVGSLIRVHLRVSGWKSRVQYLVLEDPLPAGCRSTETTLPREKYSEGTLYTLETRDDRTLAYYREIGWGNTLELEYLLRAEVPGDYHILPPRLWTMYGNLRLMGSEMRLRVSK